MMKEIFIIISLLVLSCFGEKTEITHEFKMGCFNIENFGATKASRKAVMDVLARVVEKYDLLFIQELSDKPDKTGVCGKLTGNVICKLLETTKATRYLEVSPRLSASGSGEEQYAVLYDPDQFELMSSWVVNETNEPAYDKYMRPPMITLIRSRTTDRVFAAGVCHTKPEQALQETINLAQELVSLEENVSTYSVICGDFNAQFSKANWAKYYEALPNNGTDYGMEIENGVATGVLSGATLDRIITTPALHKITSNGQAFWFNDTTKGGYSMQDILNEGCDSYLSSCTTAAATKAVSDHFPVEITIRFVHESVASSLTISSLAVLFIVLLQIIVTLH